MNPLLAVVMGMAGLVAARAAFASSPLTPERVFASPALSGPEARGPEVSPDGAWVTYLKPEATDQNKLDLWIAPTGAGEARLLVSGAQVEPPGAALSDAETARRERERMAALSGVVTYSWDAAGRRILIPAGGALYVADAGSGAVTRLDTGGHPLTDARFSERGGWASWIADQTLYVTDLASPARAVSPGGGGAVSYGVAEFVAQEEMGRFTGYWWAPDDSAVAYTRTDDGPVESAPRLEIGVEGARIAPQRYPRAGTANALVSLFIRSLATGAAPIAVDLGADPDIYLARVDWSADARALYVQRESRDQHTLDLLRVDPRTGAARVILTERQDHWVDLNDDFHSLKTGDFIWGSARTGANQLYLYSADGVLVRPITRGEAPVLADAGPRTPGVVGVDEARGLVYFMASRETPLERHLYAVSYRAPGEPVRLTEGAGWWTATMPRAANVFIGRYSDPATPPRTALFGADGRRLRWIEENALAPDHPFAPFTARYPAPRFGVLRAADGQVLHYILQTPVGFDPARTYPAIVEVYGGPHAQEVTRAWRNPAEKLYLEAGYVLFQLDNRGSGNRDLRFEQALAGHLGSVEVDDQLVGLNHLRALPFVDPDRIGVTGWSYGGYMTLRLMTDPRAHFRAGAAGAPPTDWRTYDTHYTERFMGQPNLRAADYDASAIIPRLSSLSGRLLLLQGMADDNVQFANSIAVMASLQAAAVPFDLMLYPGQRHGIQGEARRVQLWRTYLAFFGRELGGAAPLPSRGE